MANPSTVYSEHRDHITSVILNRPQKLNALTATMIGAVRDGLKAAQADPGTQVVVLRGQGTAFCAGDDIDELAHAADLPNAQAVLVANLQDVTRQIMAGPKPVVAVVQGWAVGAAFSWVLNCDLVVCAESAKAFFPEVRWGVSPTGAATVLAPALLGVGRARESFLLSRRWTAQELFSLGAVSKVVKDGEELSAGMSLASQLADLPAFALAGIKKLANQAIVRELEVTLSDEAALAIATSSRREVAQRLMHRRGS